MKKIGLLTLLLIININPLWAEEVHDEAYSSAAQKQILPLQGQDDGPENTPAHQIEINYEKDLLSLTARSVNLRELFEEISKKTKVEVILDKETGEQKISVEFKELSLKESIEKIIDLTGLKDLAIDYRKREESFEINKVEIRKRTKEDMAKIEAEEKKKLQEEYAKKEKWYQDLFKDMGKKGKLEKMLKDYAEGKEVEGIQTYLRQATIEPEEKPLLRAALWDPEYEELRGAIAMGIIHAIADHPEESDNEFLLELLKNKKIDFLMYAMKFTWDEKFIPGLIDIVRDTTQAGLTRNTAAEILGTRKVKEALPALEQALTNCTDCTEILGALRSITGLSYYIENGKVKTTVERPKFKPGIMVPGQVTDERKGKK